MGAVGACEPEVVACAVADDAMIKSDPRFPNLPREIVRAFLDAPAMRVAEIVNGELSLQPRPRPRQAIAAGELHGELRGPFQRGRGGSGDWVFLDEPELHLGPMPDIVVPDLAGWRRDRFPEDALAPATAALTTAPDWVCEVLSPSTRAYDRKDKMAVYRREGVRHVWLVDPEVRSLEVFRLEAGWYVVAEVHVGDAGVRAEPFEAIELDLSLLWNP